MSQGPLLHSKSKMSSVQMSLNAPIETSFQVPQELASNLPCQVCLSSLVTPQNPTQSCLSISERGEHQQKSRGPSRKSRTQTQPGPKMDPSLPILRSILMQPSHQIPSRFSGRSGFQGSVGPKRLRATYGNRQTSFVAPKKCRKIRTVYSQEQKRLLKEHFDECTHPNREQRLALALQIGVTDYEIQVWFKNYRAKSKQQNLQNVPSALPETNGSPKAGPESTHFPDSLLVASASGESMSSGIFALNSTPKLSCSQESSLTHDQACDGARYSQEEVLLDGCAPVTVWDSGQSVSVEAQNVLAVAEAPAAMVAATQSSEDAQDSGPSAEELWQKILEDFDRFIYW